jgi:hypothetical protein
MRIETSQGWDCQECTEEAVYRITLEKSKIGDYHPDDDWTIDLCLKHKVELVTLLTAGKSE